MEVITTVVRSTSSCKKGCGYWNRDVNGATNIYKIAYYGSSILPMALLQLEVTSQQLYLRNFVQYLDQGQAKVVYLALYELNAHVNSLENYL